MNRIAAHEVRIKLSELCYKSIACDVTEDKKHIDLSSEPMIVVRGRTARIERRRRRQGGRDLPGPQGRADRDRRRRRDALRDGAPSETISVPAVHPSLAFVLCALAGHLFGYEAALAIDASGATAARGARLHREALVGSVAAERDLDPLAALVADLEPLATASSTACAPATTTAASRPRTAVQLASMLRYAVGVVPLDAYQIDFGKVGTPSTVVEDLTAALTKAIEELTRPVDAIKHQAKTVTVGISRSGRDAAAGSAGARGARHRAPRATASPTGRCARWSRSTARSSR